MTDKPCPNCYRVSYIQAQRIGAAMNNPSHMLNLKANGWRDEEGVPGLWAPCWTCRPPAAFVPSTSHKFNFPVLCAIERGQTTTGKAFVLGVQCDTCGQYDCKRNHARWF